MTWSMPSWQALQGRIAGDVVLPGSQATRRCPAVPAPASSTFGPRPVVRCATPQDVAETIWFACGTGWSARPERGSLLRRALGEPWADHRRDADGVGLGLG